MIRDDEWTALRRQQTNWDARRRRFLRNHPRLMQENEAARALGRQVRCLDTEVQRLWQVQSRALWNSEVFDGVRSQRAKLARAIARRRRVVESAVTSELGMRPELESDEDDVTSDTIARAIAHAATRTMQNES